MKAPSISKKKLILSAVIGLAVCGAIAAAYRYRDRPQLSVQEERSSETVSSTANADNTKKSVKKKRPAPAEPAAPTPASTPAAKPVVQAPGCGGNTAAKKVVVSISQRRMWGCEGAAQAYSVAVITGMEKLAADLTPRGTFYIYGKSTNLHLKGSDSTGSWDDFVYYWMPFLSNQYGVYGFHDATWRKDAEFGNVSPYTSDASHGCVELPLAAANWLYNWAPVGTPVVIIS